MTPWGERPHTGERNDYGNRTDHRHRVLRRRPVFPAQEQGRWWRRKINEEAAIEIEEVPSQEKPITTNNISTSLDNNLEEKLSKSIKEENLLPDMMQLDFNMLEKESLLKDIANIEVMTMTPLDAMNTLFKIVQDAKKLK